jgi:hypothetical protein
MVVVCWEPFGKLCTSALSPRLELDRDILASFFRNKLPPKSTYHTLENCRKYVTKYYQQTQPTFGVYGFVPLLDRKV